MSVSRSLILILALATPAVAQDGERIARLETEVSAISAQIQKLERTLERRLDDFEDKLDKTEHGIVEQWPAGLLGVLLVLDKAGYYIRRKDGNGNRKDP